MMDYDHVVYICDVCFQLIGDEDKRTVWFINEKKMDVCSRCAESFKKALVREVKDAG